MGLATDKLFFEILKADTALMEAIGGRLHNTVIGNPEVDEANEPVPYVIVMFAGLSNDDTTKDDPYEGSTDTVNIEIEVAGNNVEELTDIAKRIRKTIHREMTWVQSFAELRDSDDFTLEDANDFRLMVVRDYDDIYSDIPYDYRFSTSDKTYNMMKPCFGMILQYQCSVENEINDEDDEQD